MGAIWSNGPHLVSCCAIRASCGSGLADGLSTFGTFIFGLSLQLLMIHILRADQLEIGWVRSAQWLPSLLFGLVAGVIVDRVRRRNLLIATDVASCVVLLAIAGLGIFGALSPLGLTVLVFLARYRGGCCRAGRINRSPPTCCPRACWRRGSVVMTQTYTAAQTLGAAARRRAGGRRRRSGHHADQRLHLCRLGHIAGRRAGPAAAGAAGAGFRRRRSARGDRLGLPAPLPRPLCALPACLVHRQRDRRYRSTFSTPPASGSMAPPSA
jgi:hypothetical protein